LTEYTTGLADIEANDSATASARLSEIHEMLKQMTKHSNELVRLNSSVQSMNDWVTKLQKENQKLSEPKGNATDIENQLAGVVTERATITKERNDLIDDRGYLDIAQTLLKDSGIKSKIIKQYLPIMNKLINKRLSEMNFFVNFTLDENFKESIKSRFRDEFVYGSFSEGQKQRIDLALLFTWRDIAAMKNSVSTNLLILDEVFDSSLDANATEDLLKILETLGAQTNVFVISHKDGVLLDKFSSVIRFQKVIIQG
jgi:DNA repair exonuclease SbcCD ATPase subunit